MEFTDSIEVIKFIIHISKSIKNNKYIKVKKNESLPVEKIEDFNKILFLFPIALPTKTSDECANPSMPYEKRKKKFNKIVLAARVVSP
tara:strand:+ start:1558 stop:1821 length:264 start_codon:yes stop_codon:yes gene_type:complete